MELDIGLWELLIQNPEQPKQAPFLLVAGPIDQQPKVYAVAPGRHPELFDRGSCWAARTNARPRSLAPVGVLIAMPFPLTTVADIYDPDSDGNADGGSHGGSCLTCTLADCCLIR